MSGDLILLVNNSTNEIVKIKVRFARYYLTFKEMLEKEGVENVLSSNPKTVEHGT